MLQGIEATFGSGKTFKRKKGYITYGFRLAKGRSEKAKKEKAKM